MVTFSRYSRVIQQRLGEVMTGAFGRQGANVCVVCGMPITERTFHLGEAGCLHLSCAPLEYSPLPPCKASALAQGKHCVDSSIERVFVYLYNK